MSYLMILIHIFIELIKCLKRREKIMLCFDEQTNNQNRKQLDLLMKYWCYNEDLVVTRYYQSILLGHATTIILYMHM
jgi:hypothetical protein